MLKTVFFDVCLLLANLLATSALFIAARRSMTRSKRRAVAWFFLACAQLSYSIADAIWLVINVGSNYMPFPSLADVFYLAYYGLALVGVLLLTSQYIRWIDHIYSLLDIGILMAAATLVIWNFLLGPIAAANASQPLIVRALSLAYPLADLALIWALLNLLYRKPKGESRVVIVLLTMGIAITIVVDLAFSALSLEGSYESGGLVDLGYLTSYVLFGLAGIAQARAATQNSSPDSEFSAAYSWTQRKPAFLLSMSYLWLIAAFGLLIASRYRILPMDYSLISIGAGAMIVLSILRQIGALWESRSLVQRLQTASELMRQQALDLQLANQALRNEINERQRAESQLAYEALHDALTGLPNQALLIDRLGRAIDAHRRRADFEFSVLVLDLDHFKKVNDTLGRSCGDQLLAIIARRLEDCAGDGASVARLSGDEFALLIEETLAEEQLQRLAGRIQEALQAPAQLNGHTFFPSASLGIVVDAHDYKRPEEILRDAELAMYRAKERGKACAEFFRPEMRRRAITHLEMETALRAALEREEFSIHYQPIVTIRDNRLVGFEALLRWNHPQRGFIPPSEFIPVAEEAGLILPLGRWVLRVACSQMVSWQHRLHRWPDLKLNVNISGLQLSQPDFTSQVAGILQETGLSGNLLRLEITESVYLNAPEAVSLAFARLRMLGVQIQLDDFGTGYSSLAYLQQYPVQAVKIDRSFTQRLNNSHNSNEIVNAIIRLAHQLGMEATAEGIEEAGQRDALLALGCDYGQGYLFSPPLEVKEAEKMLAEIAQSVHGLKAEKARGKSSWCIEMSGVNRLQ